MLFAAAYVVTVAVAGFYLTATGRMAWGSMLTGFLLPTLLGNFVGSVLLVAVLNHAQGFAEEPHAG